MKYILKYKNINVLSFNLSRTVDSVEVYNIEIYNDKIIPLDMDITKIDKWLKRRTIPSNRQYVSNFLSKLGLNERDTIGILDLSHGLSLNDSYWIIREGFEGDFDKYNLYYNRFTNSLAEIAFTGYGSHIKTSFISSPEFTTNGMLAKCWRRIKGNIYLFKSGSEGAANTGKEPYSEYYAYQIASQMGLNVVEYNLSKWKGKLCSTCLLFTDIDNGFIPTGSLVTKGGIQGVIDFYKQLGDDYLDELIRMFIFDAIICNEDRHFGNFGFIVHDHRIISTAPIFDNGLSLFYYSLDDNYKDMIEYSKTRQPRAYDDFYEILKPYLTREHKDMVRSLINFKFKKHSRYNLDKKRLEIIEKIIQDRVKDILEL